MNKTELQRRLKDLDKKAFQDLLTDVGKQAQREALVGDEQNWNRVNRYRSALLHLLEVLDSCELTEEKQNEQN